MRVLWYCSGMSRIEAFAVFKANDKMQEVGPFIYVVPIRLTTKMTELKSRPRVRLIDLLASLPKVAVLILTSFCLISGSELTAQPRHLGANKDWPDLVMAIYVS